MGTKREAVGKNFFARSHLMIRMSEDSFVNFLSLAQFQFIFSSVNDLICESFNICDFNVFSFSVLFFCPDSVSQIYNILVSFHFTEIKLFILLTWSNTFLMYEASRNGIQTRFGMEFTFAQQINLLYSLLLHHRQA